MNSKLKLLLAIAALVIVVGGASLLYPMLASQYQSPQGFTQLQATQVPTETPTTGAAETATAIPATPTATPLKTTLATATATAQETATAASEPEATPEEAAPEATVYLAPDFEVYDEDGNPFHLSDFRGKPVIMNFWATWCPPCKSELPAFNRLAAECGEDVVFLMIDMTDGARETIDGVKAFIAENGYTFPVYYDTKYSAAMTYGANSIPMTVLVDAQGAPVGYAVGALSESVLRQAITERLGVALE